VVCSVIYQEAATIDVLSPFFLSLAAFYELPRIPVMRSSRFLVPDGDLHMFKNAC
jgi:hypothetical protein